MQPGSEQMISTKKLKRKRRRLRRQYHRFMWRKGFLAYWRGPNMHVLGFVPGSKMRDAINRATMSAMIHGNAIVKI